MKKIQIKVTPKTSHEEGEEEVPVGSAYYAVETQNGDIFITVNVARESDVKVMSGQPPASGTPKPPGT